MWRDFRFSMHQWKRNKGYAALIVFILAVAIGANTLIFSFIEAVMLKPLPVSNPQNLFLAYKFFLGNKALGASNFYYSAFQEIQARKDLFSSAMPKNTGQKVASCRSTRAAASNWFLRRLSRRTTFPTSASTRF